MKCGYCDSELEPADAFCPSCGTRVDGWTAPRPNHPTPRGVGDPRKPLFGNPHVSKPYPTPETLTPSPLHPSDHSDISLSKAVASIFVSVVVLVGCIVLWVGRDNLPASLGGASHTIEGSLLLTEGGDPRPGSCSGTGGYSNVYPGAGVVVFNEKNEPIGTGSLDSGASWGGEQCRFEFVIEDVPKAKFYTIEISGRGGPTNSYAEMEASDWRWDLTLG